MVTRASRPESALTEGGPPRSEASGRRGVAGISRAPDKERPMSTDEFAPLTPEELAGEGITALPDKEVVSILDLAADVDLAIDGAAPIDLAVALNANVVAPIDAAVSANLLSDDSSAQALSDQGVQVTQNIDANATATGLQDSSIDQSDTVQGGGEAIDTTDTGSGASSDGLLTAAT